jgi:hypothetical protein
MSFRGVDATMMAPSDPSDAIDLVEMITDLMDSDPERQRSMTGRWRT